MHVASTTYLFTAPHLHKALNMGQDKRCLLPAPWVRVPHLTEYSWSNADIMSDDAPVRSPILTVYLRSNADVVRQRACTEAPLSVCLWTSTDSM